jgi:hypothetical protein
MAVAPSLVPRVRQALLPELLPEREFPPAGALRLEQNLGP